MPNFDYNSLPKSLQAEVNRQLVAQDDKVRQNKIRIPGKPRYRSKLERVFAENRIPIIAPDWWGYERFTFGIPSGKYTPDFNIFKNGLLYHVEIKGSRKSRGAIRTLLMWKQAVVEYAWDERAVWVWCEGMGFECTYSRQDVSELV